jgi:hypothetical protein
MRSVTAHLRGLRTPSRFDLWECIVGMILFVNPRATRPKNRRFPLSIMAVGAALPEGVNWEIVDGNLPNRRDLRACPDTTTRRNVAAILCALVAIR